MKRTIISFFCMFLLCGCIQSKEQLIIRGDGSGTLRSHMKVPAGTVQLVDMMLGGMMQAMAGALAEGDQAQEPPKSVADQMFGNRTEILKKAKEAGANIQFVSFHKENKEDGLYIDYELTFDDIYKLLSSGIVATNLEIEKDTQGNWAAFLKQDSEKEEKSKVQIQQFLSFKDSEQFSQMPPAMQQMVLEAMHELKIEFFITLPYDIQEITGAFKKENSRTAHLDFSGDIIEDPTVIEKLYGMTGEVSRVVWGPGKINITPTESKEHLLSKKKPEKQQSKEGILQDDLQTTQQDQPEEQQKNDSTVKVYLKNGNVFEGTRTEQTPEYIRMDIEGVSITYYQDEIRKIE